MTASAPLDWGGDVGGGRIQGHNHVQLEIIIDDALVLAELTLLSFLIYLAQFKVC